MAPFRSTCSECGDVELRSRDIQVRICGDNGQATYLFRCPVCRMTEVKFADDQIIDILAAGGVRCIDWRLPLELTERPKVGDPITHDVVLDFYELTDAELRELFFGPDSTNIVSSEIGVDEVLSDLDPDDERALGAPSEVLLDSRQPETLASVSYDLLSACLVRYMEDLPSLCVLTAEGRYNLALLATSEVTVQISERVVRIPDAQAMVIIAEALHADLTKQQDAALIAEALFHLAL